MAVTDHARTHRRSCCNGSPAASGQGSHTPRARYSRRRSNTTLACTRQSAVHTPRGGRSTAGCSNRGHTPAGRRSRSRSVGTDPSIPRGAKRRGRIVPVRSPEQLGQPDTAHHRSGSHRRHTDRPRPPTAPIRTASPQGTTTPTNSRTPAAPPQAGPRVRGKDVGKPPRAAPPRAKERKSEYVPPYWTHTHSTNRPDSLDGNVCVRRALPAAACAVRFRQPGDGSIPPP